MPGRQVPCGKKKEEEIKEKVLITQVALYFILQLSNDVIS
jgi:hypothetical protein